MKLKEIINTLENMAEIHGPEADVVLIADGRNRMERFDVYWSNLYDQVSLEPDYDPEE